MLTKYYENSRSEVLRKLVKLRKGRVLEVGCGKGILLSSLASAWPEYDHVGVDVFNAGVEKPGYKFVNCDINELSSRELGKFDLIIMLDVIEHIDDYAKTLRKLKEFGSKDAIYVFSIPNIRFVVALYYLLWKRDFPELDSGIFDRTHLRFFTKKKIVRILNNASLSIEEIKGINSIVDVQKTILYKMIALSLIPFLAFLGLDCIYQQFYVLATNKLNNA